MSKTGFYKGRLGIGLTSTMGMGDGNPRYPLDINGDIRLTGAIVNGDGLALNMVNPDSLWMVDAANNTISYSAGNVGIGTTSPSTTLHVKGEDNQLRLQTTRSSGSHLNWSPSGAAGSDWDLRYSSDGSSQGDRLWLWYNGDQHFYTNNGTDRMIIKSGGNVGIGTTGPGGKLHVVGSSGVHALRITGNSSHVGQIYATGSNYGIRIITAASSGSYYSAYFEGSSGKGLYVRDDGNVGIGTTNPGSYRLKVDGGDVYISNNFFVGSFKVDDVGGHSHISNIAGGGRLEFHTAGYNKIMVLHGTQNSGHIEFNGNVGIGTTSPQTKLQIGGQENYPSYISNSEDALCVMHSTATSSTVLNDPQPCLILGRPGTSGQTQSSAAIFNIHRYENNSVNARTQLSINLLHGGNATTDNVLVCRSNGNVGIGTTGPNCKLDVNGQIRGGYNTDTLSYFGRTWVGVVGGLTDHAGIGHIDHIGNGEYALMQANNGKTYLGSVSGQSIGFRIGNSDKMELNTSGQLKVAYDTDTYCYFGRAFIGASGHSDYAGFGHLHCASSTSYGFMQGYQGWTYINCKTSTGIAFRINNTDQMRMDSNGNFGIGTTSPGAKLEMKSSAGVFTGNLKSIHSNGSECITMGYGGISTGTTHSLRFGVNNSEKMRIDNDGRVGIGTSSPHSKFHLTWGSTGDVWTTGKKVTDCHMLIGGYEWGGAGETLLIGLGYWDRTAAYVPNYIGTRIISSATDTTAAIVFGTRNSTSDTTAPAERMCILHNGRVGIGTTNPGYPLQVTGYAEEPGTNMYIHNYQHYGSSYTAYWEDTTTFSVAIYTDRAVYATGGFGAPSDSRIKENICDVPDDLSLEKLRNIEVKYYEYKDKLNKGSDKTIGFIAQQVKTIMPMAVKNIKEYIPVLELLNNFTWEKMDEDESSHENYKYKLITDLTDVSGVKCKFYVSNDLSNNDEIMKEVVGNSDNTFYFDTSYNYVFYYGKEVEDFNALDKQKLFALNFSATQELDRKVIALENENAELKTKVATLESELAAIKQHLGI